MISRKVYGIFAFFLLAAVVNVDGKKGDTPGYKTTYACEGKNLNIVCDEGTIHLIRANYGRFSISICNDHGNLDWRVNCMSHHSFLIMQERCGLKTNCSVNVSSTTFHDPCPGTLKYLEVQYHCGTGPLITPSTTSTTPSTRPSFISNITAIPIAKIHTASHRTTVSTVAPTMPIIPLLRTSTVSPKRIPTTPPNNKTDGLDYSTPGRFTDLVPTMDTVSFSVKTSTASTTTVFYNEGYCMPTVSRGIHWSWTKVGETAFSKCPDGATGTSKWYCKGDPPRWNPELPDLLQCHSIWLENLRERLQDGDSIISITSELAVMSSAKPLFSEDLKIISEVIQQATYKSVHSMENFLDTWHRYHVLRELLQSSVQTLDNLLSPRQDSSWKDLQLFEKKLVISSFLENLDESALLLAETSSDDSSFSLVKKNVWLSLQILKARNQKSLAFPTFLDISEEDITYWLNMQDSITLPQEAIEDHAKNGFYKVVFSVFNKLDNYLIPGPNIPSYPQETSTKNATRIINSKVISTSLDKSGKIKLRSPVVITLRHIIEENVTNPVCVFWDFHIRDWSAQGCRVDSTNKTHTICLCNHLTNFALLMDLQTETPPATNSSLFQKVVTAGCVICIISLLLSLIILFMLSVDLSEDSIFIHRNIFTCLLISELTFLIGIKQTYQRVTCSVIAGFLQYIFLVTFSWVFFECYHQYVTLIRSSDAKKSKYWWYYLTAYIIPGIITGISAVIDPSSYGTEQYCWLQADNYFVFSFVGPAVGILFGGFVFLCIALCMFHYNISSAATIKSKDSANLQNYRSWNKRSFLLLLVLTLTWSAGFVFVNEESTALAYTFSVFNSIQGLGILFAYCFLNEKVKDDIRKLLRYDFCFKRNKQEPDIAIDSVASANAAAEADSQDFWTLPKEKISASSSNIASDSSVIAPGRHVFNEGEEDMRSQNAFWMSRANATWKPAYYPSERKAGENQDRPQKHRRFPLTNPKDKNQQNFVAPENNGQFLDHIYETIDDDVFPDEDENKGSFQDGQRFPPPENYYGDHSDLSQQSSSSCGYDHQPLIMYGIQNGQSVPEYPYPFPKDSHVIPYPDEAKNWDQKQNESLKRQKSPPEKQIYPQKGNAEIWDTSLPDLLQSPPDSSAVLAVLDGDKVVNRIQQDDVVIKPQYKLSTYC